MQKRIILSVIILFFLSVNLQAQVNQDDNNTKWINYTDTVFNFSFQYPNTWQFKLPTATTRFFVTSYQENDADKFRENVNCIARKIPQSGLMIKDAESSIKKSLSEKLTNYKLISSEYIKWNKTDALQMNYTCTQKSGEDDLDIHMFQQVAIVNGVLFSLTFTAELAWYDKYINIVDKMYRSFTVSNK